MPDRQSKALVRKLLDNPLLPAYIAELDTPTLGKLIQRIGAEDAQELMVLASKGQMQELVEMEAWTRDRPGEEERFDPDKFLEWIEIWNDMSAEFMTAKLVDLGEDLLALTLVKYVTVVNTQERGIYGFGLFDDTFGPYTVIPDTFGPYAVLPHDEETCRPILAVIADVWSEDSDFLMRVLARCHTQYSATTDSFELTNNEEKLANDTAGARQANRESKGYVMAADAVGFLSAAKHADMQELLIKVTWDNLTRGHLTRLARVRDAASKTASDYEGDTTKSAKHAATSGADDADSVPLSPDAQEELRQTNEWRELDALLAAERITARAPPRQLLTGPSPAPQSYLRRALNAMEPRDGVALAQRLDEILYLANILVSGSGIQGGLFTEEEAARAVYATCNLGLEYCITEEPFDSEEAMLDSFLLAEPGLVKAFEIGYHLICQLPNKAMSATARELMRPQVRSQLREHSWLQEQIGRAIGGRDPHGEFTPESLEGTHEIFETLSLLFDGDDCWRLRVLCDPFPCFPKSLEPDAVQGTHVDKRIRYITRPSDLRRIASYLEEVAL